MEQLFYAIVLLIILMVVMHCVDLYSEIKFKKMTQLFKQKAFFIHSFMSLTTWSLSFFLIFVLQFTDQPRFEFPEILILSGLPIMILGIILSMIGYLTLGLKRSLHSNVFYPNTSKRIKKGIYKYISDPEYIGFYMILIGLTLITTSFYNLIITIEFILVMIPLRIIENMPIKEK